MANKKKVKYAIQVWNMGKVVGYLKSVSYTKRTFSMTNDVRLAKKYVTQDYVWGEIDTLTGINSGYGYTYVEV